MADTPKLLSSSNNVYINDLPEAWPIEKKKSFLEQLKKAKDPSLKVESYAQALDLINKGTYIPPTNAEDMGVTSSHPSMAGYPIEKEVQPNKEELAQQELDAQPKTTLKGIGSALARGGGQTAVAGGLGAIGGALSPVGPAGGAVIGAGLERVITPVLDTVIPAINELFGTNITPGTESWNNLMTKIGMEVPDTTIEKGAEAVGKGLAEGAGTIGAGKAISVLSGGIVPGMAAQNLGQKIGKVLMDQPLAELVGSAGAETAAVIAKENGKGPVTQLLAAVGGGLLGGFTGGQVDNLVSALKNKAPLTTEMRDLLDSAEAMGIDIYKSDIFPPKSRFGRAMNELLRDMPGGTSSQKLAQNEQRIAAAKDFIKQFNATNAGYVADDVATDFWRVRGTELAAADGLKKDVLERVYDAADGAPMDTSNTIKMIEEEVDRISKLGNKKLDGDILELNNWAEMLQGKDLAQIESHRRYLSDIYSAQDLGTITKDAQKFANKVYGSLREDMSEYIKTYGPNKEADLNQFNVAMSRLKSLTDQLDDSALKNAFNKGKDVPEAISSLVSKDPSTVKKLYDNLSDGGREAVKSNIWANWIKRSTDQEDLSTNTLSKLISDELTSTKGSQKLLPFFKGDDFKTIEGFQRVIDKTSGAEGIAGKTSLPKDVMRGIALPGMSYAAARMVGGGNIAGVVAAGGALFTAGKLAQIAEMPAARNLAIALANAPKDSAREMEIVKRLIDIARTIEEPKEAEGQDTVPVDVIRER